MHPVRTFANLPYRHLILAGLFGLLLGGCSRTAQSQPAPALPEVATVTVAAQSVTLTTELPGRTASYRVAEIRPQASGLIKKRLFTEGVEVKAGQVLYRIDAAPFEAAMDNAKATLTASEKNFDRSRASLAAAVAALSQQQATLALAQTNRQRFEEAFAANAVSASQRDTAVTEAEVAAAALEAAQARVESERKGVAAAEAAIAQAEAARKSAAINLGYTTITAPISGRIGKSNVTDGAIVTAYQPVPIATIQQLDPIYVDVPQSTSELLRWQRNLGTGRLVSDPQNARKVDLLLEDGTPFGNQGSLQFRDVTVDPTTGSVILRMVFPNPDGILLPGMFVRTVVQEGIAQNAILVPQQGVTRDPKGNPIAWIVDETGKVAQRMLTLDRAIGDQWLVSTGLNPGDRLIVEGSQRVRPGMPVKAVDFQKPAPAPKPAKTAQPA